jgi:hypothetical protein
MGKVEGDHKSPENETTRKRPGETPGQKWAQRFREKCHAVRRKWGEETEEEELRKDRQTDREAWLHKDRLQRSYQAMKTQLYGDCMICNTCQIFFWSSGHGVGDGRSM